MRRESPMIQSTYEDPQFSPGYSLGQLEKKGKHPPKTLDKSRDKNSMNSSTYKKLPESKKRAISIELPENLLKTADTQIFYNVSFWSNSVKEPIIAALNFGYGDYPIRNHLAMFENKEQYKLNAFIADYVLNDNQIRDFNESLATDPTLGIPRIQNPTESVIQDATQNPTTAGPEI